MRDQLVGLLECALIEQKLDALASRHLALFMLAFAALGTSAIFRKLVPLLEFGDFLLEIHGGRIIAVAGHAAYEDGHAEGRFQAKQSSAPIP